MQMVNDCHFLAICWNHGHSILFRGLNTRLEYRIRDDQRNQPWRLPPGFKDKTTFYLQGEHGSTNSDSSLSWDAPLLARKFSKIRGWYYISMTIFVNIVILLAKSKLCWLSYSTYLKFDIPYADVCRILLAGWNEISKSRFLQISVLCPGRIGRRKSLNTHK